MFRFLNGWKGCSTESWMIMWMDIMNILQSAMDIWRRNVNTYRNFLQAETFILWPGILIPTKSTPTYK
jgi:hypothetical protein